MRALFISLILVTSQLLQAQAPHFRKIGTADGLNDGSIVSFGQDKYGYIWIGTSSGLNRYDGYRIKQYLNIPHDTSSIYPGQVWGMTCGPDGNMYFGMEGGFARFNYATANFTRLKGPRPFTAGSMAKSGKDILLATSAGLVYFHPETGRFDFFSDSVKDSKQKKLAVAGLGDMELLPDGRVLATSRIGLIVIDPGRQQVKKVTVPELGSQFFSNVEVTKDGTVWLSLLSEPKLVKTDTSFKRFTMHHYLFANRNVVKNAISELLVDREDNLWVTTVPDGLCFYNKQRNNFTRFINEPFQPASLSANHLTAIFQDKEGIIWTGTGGYGVHYFHPEKKLFQTILPHGNATTAGGWMWARAASQDHEGKLWLATLDGVAHYDLERGFIRNFRNEENKPPQIYSNSVRGMLCDGDLVWILTGEGVNRYHRMTGKMEFLGEKDSLPRAFYFTVLKDTKGTIWLGGRDFDGLYFSQAQQGFRSIKHHPVLKALTGYGVRCIFEDGKSRLWFGLNGGGLALYNPEVQMLKHWQWKENDTASLVGNLVTGISEGPDGMYWISTTTGIAYYDEKSGRFHRFTKANGLPAVHTSCIRVDRLNRVWAGSTQGLLMLDEGRSAWKVFDQTDGLASLQFADMPSNTLNDGRFIFPSLNGFVVFQPTDYKKEARAPDIFISAFDVFNQPASATKNYEEVKSMHLSYKQNFFTIELTALHYENPLRTWYAFKLDGFDKNWIYTQERTVNYTNVPGGTYTFRYKASADRHNWNVPEHTLAIEVGTVYYETAWFWLVLLCFSMFGLHAVYRFRMNKQRQILQLETKAKELEKEKTVVQYESLKQQLNPHFLFNSLTSLRSLIKTDAKTATGFLDGLSKVYRYVLKSGEKELSLLSDETEFVKTFVQLQKTRFRDGLEVSFQIDDKHLGRYIVPVTLQNLLENAIKHNTADAESPLRIQINVEQDHIIVRNNLQRYAIVESSNKHGLSNLKKLYGFYTDKPILIIDDGKWFTVKIPLL
jgi:ligand-binding sensor domain-containing protein